MTHVINWGTSRCLLSFTPVPHATLPPAFVMIGLKCRLMTLTVPLITTVYSYSTYHKQPCLFSISSCCCLQELRLAASCLRFPPPSPSGFVTSEAPCAQMCTHCFLCWVNWNVGTCLILTTLGSGQVLTTTLWEHLCLSTRSTSAAHMQSWLLTCCLIYSTIWQVTINRLSVGFNTVTDAV